MNFWVKNKTRTWKEICADMSLTAKECREQLQKNWDYPEYVEQAKKRRIKSFSSPYKMLMKDTRKWLLETMIDKLIENNKEGAENAFSLYKETLSCRRKYVRDLEVVKYRNFIQKKLDENGGTWNEFSDLSDEEYKKKIKEEDDTRSSK